MSSASLTAFSDACGPRLVVETNADIFEHIRLNSRAKAQSACFDVRRL